MDAATYNSTLRAAQADLGKVRDQFEELKKQKDDLEALVALLMRILPSQPQLPMQLPERESFELPEEPKPARRRRSPNGTRKLAIDAISRTGRALTVPEIHRYIASIMGDSAPKRESIRVLMLRSPETFEALGEGLYGLKAGHELAEEDVEAA